jgi:ribonuclease HI
MNNIEENALTIYTDGSSYSNPRRGGAGVICVYIGHDGNEVIEEKEVTGYKGATNNQMELLACIEGLKQAYNHHVLSKVQEVVIRTDSQYITNNFLLALRLWPSNKWRNKEDRPIENAQLWKDFRKQFLKLINGKRTKVKIEWVEGHAKDPYNKAADKRAKASAKGILNKPLIPVQLRRKQTSEVTEIGSVGILGQRISIRIVSAQLLQLQKIYKYSYEVTSRNSKYFRKKDIIFSKENLKAGHIYYVIFSKNPKNPDIKKVIREISKK